MAVYVDPANFKKVGGRKAYAHMVADSLEELHLFAARISVKPHFFHKSASYLHYDITAEQRLAAISSGAIEVTSKQLLIKAKEMTSQVKTPQ